MLPRMTTLLETAAHNAGNLPLTIGLTTFGLLVSLLLILLFFGSGRPHATSR